MATAIINTVSSTLGWATAKAGEAEEYMVQNWLRGWTPSCIPDLHGKVAVVTGGNSGIGYETARKLAENGARVVLVSRSVKNGEQAAASIRQAVGKGCNVEVAGCDMSVLANVADLVARLRRSENHIDMLINMAGVFEPGPYAQTKDGIEQTLAINYFSHALLTLGLLDVLRATPRSRVIMMSAPGEQYAKLDKSNLKGDKYSDSGLVPYATSMLYKLMFARELSSRVPEVDFLGVHPGLVSSPLLHKASLRYPTAILSLAAGRLFGQTPYRGSFSTLYAATEPSLTGKGFAFYGPNALDLFPTTERTPRNRAVRNPWACWQLFERTVEVVMGALGPAALPNVPRHPDDVYGDSPSGVCRGPRAKTAPPQRARATPPSTNPDPVSQAPV